MISWLKEKVFGRLFGDQPEEEEKFPLFNLDPEWVEKQKRWLAVQIDAACLLDTLDVSDLPAKKEEAARQEVYEGIWNCHIDIFGETYSEVRERMTGKKDYTFVLDRGRRLSPTDEWLAKQEND